MKPHLFFAVSLVFTLFSCAKPVPQFPANKGSKTDSTEINLRKINEVLARKEDSVIQTFIHNQTLPYEKAPSGIWFYKKTTTTLDSLKNKPTVYFTYKCYTVQGEYVKTEKIKLNFGKKEVPTGLEEGVKMMRSGETMLLIVPWYLAYGITGKDNIQPYTSLIYEVTDVK